MRRPRGAAAIGMLVILAIGLLWLYRKLRLHTLLKPLPFGLPGVDAAGPPPLPGGAGRDY